MLIFIKRKIRFLISIPLYLLSFLVYLFIKLVSTIVVIRFGFFRNDVIGNSLFDLEYYLSYTKKYKNKYIYKDFFFPTINKYPNKFFFTLAKRSISISSLYKYIYDTIKYFNDNKHIVSMVNYSNGSRDVIGLLKTSNVNLKFNRKEQILGKDFLNRYLIKSNKFICVLVRDNAYKKKYQKHIKDNWSYHNYRNTDIEKFKESILYLIQQGYYVIRMGKSAEKKLDINNSKFIDYPFIKDKNDFLDIWLMANCFFCVTTGTGLDDVCVTFRKPIVEVSYLPIGYLRCNQAQTVSIFKKLQNKKTKKFLSIKDQISYNLIDALHKNMYENKNIEIIDNTSKEILEAVTEMDLKLNNRWFEDDKDIKNQEIFFDHIKKWKEFNNKIGKLNSQSRVGRSFLRNNISWLIN